MKKHMFAFLGVLALAVLMLSVRHPYPSPDGGDPWPIPPVAIR